MAISTEPAISAANAHIKTAITNVRVFDGQRLGELTTVVIDGEVIGGDADGARVIDGQGGVLLPGLIDAHVHLHGEETLRQMSYFGVTTGLDMATWPPEKLNALRGRVGLTDIRSPGMPATAAGSVHSLLLPLVQDAFVANPEDAVRYVSNRVAEGVDYIKVIADVPGPDQATLNALVAAAHQHQKFVVAHASAFIPFRMAQDAKVDMITHSPRDKALDNEAVARMVADQCVSIPTLTMMEGLARRPSLGILMSLLLRPWVLMGIIRARRQNPHGGNERYEHARDSVTAMYRAGVPILAGTDANAAEGSPFPVKHGEALHHELELLVEAGLSTVDALRAATCLPAKHFGLNDRGVVDVGKRADLVLIAEDPILDIRATRSIQRVWCGGVEVSRT